MARQLPAASLPHALRVGRPVRPPGARLREGARVPVWQGRAQRPANAPMPSLVAHVRPRRALQPADAPLLVAAPLRLGRALRPAGTRLPVRRRRALRPAGAPMPWHLAPSPRLGVRRLVLHQPRRGLVLLGCPGRHGHLQCPLSGLLRGHRGRSLLGVGHHHGRLLRRAQDTPADRAALDVLLDVLPLGHHHRASALRRLGRGHPWRAAQTDRRWPVQARRRDHPWADWHLVVLLVRPLPHRPLRAERRHRRSAGTTGQWAAGREAVGHAVRHKRRHLPTRLRGGWPAET
mmetsp:Transcript_100186/g.299042  ORF Transcript_100186/g.299042 Transcript_100186/m.299042 type:complete len:290 (-) Transcript_100186:12-881(-)